MAIGNIGTGSLQGDNRFVPRKSSDEGVRTPESEKALQAATLHPLRRLAPEEIGPLQAVYSQTLSDVGSLQSSRQPVDQARMFPFDDDGRKVRQATRVARHDETEVKGLKRAYRQAFNEARRDRARAERLIDRHGQGQHQLPGGVTLDVHRSAEDGFESVTTRTAEGQSRTVELSNHLPDYVSTRETRQDGTAVAVHQLGSQVVRDSGAADGTRLSESYYLNRDGTAAADVAGSAVGGEMTTAVTPEGKAHSTAYGAAGTGASASTLAGPKEWWHKAVNVEKKIQDNVEVKIGREIQKGAQALLKLDEEFAKLAGADPIIKKLGAVIHSLGAGLGSAAAKEGSLTEKLGQLMELVGRAKSTLAEIAEKAGISPISAVLKKGLPAIGAAFSGRDAYKEHREAAEADSRGESRKADLLRLAMRLNTAAAVLSGAEFLTGLASAGTAAPALGALFAVGGVIGVCASVVGIVAENQKQ